MIKSVADVMRRNVGKTGEVCRLGGDEFVLILPGADREQAILISAQIAGDIKKCVVGGSHGISMSFGFKEADYSDE